jgi:hypothetical protein
MDKSTEAIYLSFAKRNIVAHLLRGVDQMRHSNFLLRDGSHIRHPAE